MKIEPIFGQLSLKEKLVLRSQSSVLSQEDILLLENLIYDHLITYDLNNLEQCALFIESLDYCSLNFETDSLFTYRLFSALSQCIHSSTDYQNKNQSFKNLIILTNNLCDLFKKTSICLEYRTRTMSVLYSFLHSYVEHNSQRLKILSLIKVYSNTDSYYLSIFEEILSAYIYDIEVIQEIKDLQNYDRKSHFKIQKDYHMLINQKMNHEIIKTEEDCLWCIQCDFRMINHYDDTLYKLLYDLATKPETLYFLAQIEHEDKKFQEHIIYKFYDLCDRYHILLKEVYRFAMIYGMDNPAKFAINEYCRMDIGLMERCRIYDFDHVSSANRQLILEEVRCVKNTLRELIDFDDSLSKLYGSAYSSSMIADKIAVGICKRILHKSKDASDLLSKKFFDYHRRVRNREEFDSLVKHTHKRIQIYIDNKSTLESFDGMRKKYTNLLKMLELTLYIPVTIRGLKLSPPNQLLVGILEISSFINMPKYQAIFESEYMHISPYVYKKGYEIFREILNESYKSLLLYSLRCGMSKKVVKFYSENGLLYSSK